MHSQSLPTQFLQETKDSPTLCISTCTLDSGGCHAFGTSLSKELHHDYVGTCESLFFSENITKGNSYKNVYITGCRIGETSHFLAAQQRYDFSKLNHVYLVMPPWVVVTPQYELLDSALNLEYSRNCQYQIKLVTSGIAIDHVSSIGIPPPFPLAAPKNQNKILNDETFGVIYIRNLIFLNDEDKYDEIFKKSVEIKNFLYRYFSKVIDVATQQGIPNPSILILGNTGPIEKSLYEIYVKPFNLKLIFKDKLPEDQFISALREINQKNGVVACNGVQTFIQGNLLECTVLFHSNKISNLKFLKELLSKIPQAYHGVANEILGLTEGLEFKKHPDQVKKVYEIIQTNIKNGTEKFKQLEKACQITPESKDAPRSSLPELETITGLKWKHNSKKGSFFYIGKLSLENAETLKPLNYKVSKVAPNNPLYGHDIYLIDDNQDNLKLMKEMVNQRKQSPGLKK